jgi:hypothetical protein
MGYAKFYKGDLAKLGAMPSSPLPKGEDLR